MATWDGKSIIRMDETAAFIRRRPLLIGSNLQHSQSIHGNLGSFARMVVIRSF
jgi:hypothetical protein